MAHMFTVCRVGQEWAVRDATGALYGASVNLGVTCEAADRMANRIGGSVTVTDEARAQLTLLGFPDRYPLARIKGISL
jgi:hypothetical protein